MKFEDNFSKVAEDAECTPTELPTPDIHYFNAALGWLDLGNAKEAAAELERIKPSLRVHPDVLLLKCAIYSATGHWKNCLAVAQTLTEEHPLKLAPWLYLGRSLHHLNRNHKAYAVLSNVTDRFPGSAELFYLLGVLAWNIKECALAKRWLSLAFKIGGKQLKNIALQNKEMAPFWMELGLEH